VESRAHSFAQNANEWGTRQGVGYGWLWFYRLTPFWSIIGPAFPAHCIGSDARLEVRLLPRRNSSAASPLCRFKFLFILLPIAGLALVTACGGGSPVSGGGNPPPASDFAVSVSSSSLDVGAGSSETITISVSGSNGFNSKVNISFSNLPPLLTISPPNIAIGVGESQLFTFAAASYASASSSSITIMGTSQGRVHQADLAVQVIPYSGNIALSRTRYVRTDAVLPYTVLFDSPTNRFFMSDPGSNQIFVLDAGSRQLVGSIPVPGAFGMDESPDHTILYAGTQIGDVYAIDPVNMTVTHRYLASQIGPDGYQVYAVQVMANGELALLGGQGGIPSVDGYSSFALWNPVDNSIEINGGRANRHTCANAGYIFGFTATGDRRLLVLSSGNNLCTIDPVTDEVNSANIVGFPVTPTPDGKSLLVLQYGIAAQMLVVDPQTLLQTGSFPVVGPSGANVVISPDSRTVYITPQLGGIAYIYDVASGNELGWMPDLYVGGIGTWISAIDNTGVLAGVTVEGIGFLDAAALQSGSAGMAFLNGYLDPATGPAAGGTSVNMDFPRSLNLAIVYFGQNPATTIDPNPPLLHAITPPGAPGPVDVVSIMTDGGTQILPEAFNYGPTILEVTPNVSTAEGGGTGVIYGYGFGPRTGPRDQIPPELEVKVGGQTARITGFNAYGYSYGYAPTPVQSVSFAISPGLAGSAADVTVNSQSGRTSLSGSMHYLPAVQQFALGGSALAQGIYDQHRDVYYFTDTNEIRVFSKSGEGWLSPISIPAPNGATQRLWGIALSPDGTKLAVADISAGVIYELNPSDPTSVRTFFVAATVFGTVSPVGVAISDNGVIYYSAYGGGHGFFKLNTNTGKITDYGIMPPGLFYNGYPQDVFLRTAISADNSRVFFNNDGAVFSIDTTTDTITWAAVSPNCCYGDYDLTLSSGQTTLEATSYVYDINLNAESYLVLNDREFNDIAYVYGAQLSADGKLLFQPSTNGIDVFDGRLGTLRSRIALPFSLSQNYDALVADGKDNILIAITGSSGSGVAVVDLTSLVEPPPLPYDTHTHAGWEVGSIHGVAQSTHQDHTTRDPHVYPRSRIRHVFSKSFAPGSRPGGVH